MAGESPERSRKEQIDAVLLKLPGVVSKKLNQLDAYFISDRIIIMQRGRVVESGAARAVLDNPQHPYSILLKESVLSLETIGEGILGSARARIGSAPGAARASPEPRACP